MLVTEVALSARSAKIIGGTHGMAMWVPARLVIMFLVCLILTASTTELLKLTCGALRPGFARVCLSNTNFPPTAYDSEVIWSNSDCQNEDTGLLNEYRKSFPSGHSSYAFAASVFVSLYFIWRSNSLRGPNPQRSQLVFSQILMFLVCFPLWCAMLIAASRVSDFKHFPVDILGGAAIGTIFAAFTFFITASNLSREYRNILMRSMDPASQDQPDP